MQLSEIDLQSLRLARIKQLFCLVFSRGFCCYCVQQGQARTRHLTYTRYTSNSRTLSEICSQLSSETLRISFHNQITYLLENRNNTRQMVNFLCSMCTPFLAILTILSHVCDYICPVCHVILLVNILENFYTEIFIHYIYFDGQKRDSM